MNNKKYYCFDWSAAVRVNEEVKTWCDRELREEMNRITAPYDRGGYIPTIIFEQLIESWETHDE